MTKMKNKVELWKAIKNFIFVILIMIIVFGGILFYQYRVYTSNFNNKIGSIIEKVLKEKPDIEESELIGIINSKEDIDVKLFEKYGINLEKNSIILNNSEQFKVFLFVDLFILIVFSILLLIIFLRYNRNKDRKLNEITKYIEEINNRNYRLDIDDNTEDELSILKNEVYKTTVTLKEIAENSVKDKLNLKESLSDISHQLKTPLTSITIMLDNILDNSEMDYDTRIDFIKDIKKQIVSINFLINSLLKLSKLDANSINFINKEEYIEEIVNEVVKNVSVLCDLKNVKINISGDKESKIYCDKKWQIEALTNILKNAVEASKENSIVYIKFEQNKIYSKIEIIDYGAGIDKDDLPYIFERFYKCKNSSDESVGIGLALSKAIIEKNNGNISVNSELNEGTKFIIRYFW